MVFTRPDSGEWQEYIRKAQSISDCMARRTGLTRAELHSKALAIGSDLIAEQGLTKFSMRQVAKSIGYTVGTLYNVFEGQDDFLLQINTITLTNLQLFIKVRLDANLHGINILHNIANSYFTFAKENYNLWRVLFEYNLINEKPLPEWYLDKINSLIMVAENALSELKMSKIQIQRSSRVLWASVHGICALSLTGKLSITKSSPAEELIHDLIDKYFIGLTSKV